MDLALRLARQALGRTSPNPAVGAVLVKDGRILGQGWTQPPGGPHAEIVALQEAGAAALGATMYVTLEPCCHFGRTPPCTKAIIAAGVSSVEIATRDENPLVAGRGCEELEAAGLRISVGCGEDEARQINEAFRKYITTGLPFITVKWAMTFDGKIASRTGHSRWVSGEAARHWVHHLRDISDAIVVGANTVRIDDPELTVRLPSDEPSHDPTIGSPLRVVVSSRAALPTDARLFSVDLGSGTLVATTSAADPSTVALLADRGVEVLILPEEDGLVDLRALLSELARRGRISVLVEGGGDLIARLLRDGLVDKICAFVAPKIIGGSKAPSPVGGLGVESMQRAVQIERLRVETVGEDVLLVGYPRGSLVGER